MGRDLGVRRALRWLDHLPAGIAFAVSVGIGGAVGFFCLRSVGDVSLPRALLFLALVALAAPLAISARPVAVPVEVEAAEDAPRPWWRPSPKFRVVLIAGVAGLAMVVGVGVFGVGRYLASRKATNPGPSAIPIATPLPSAPTAATAPPAVSSTPAQASPLPTISAGSPGIDQDYGRFDAVPVKSGVAIATTGPKPTLLDPRPPASTSPVQVKNPTRPKGTK